MLQAHITLINADRGWQFSEWYEDLDNDLTTGDIYRLLQREFGRCTGKVYIDPGIHVGWCFESRQRYEDTNEPYLREAWVSLVDHQPARYEHQPISEL